LEKQGEIQTHHKNLISIVIIIIVNLLIYLPVIYLFPAFIGDDYIIFSLIQNNPSEIVSTNPHEIYYLFLRPVTYFTFWIDYRVFGIHSGLMKLLSLVYLIVLQISFYYLLKRVLEFFDKEYKNVYILLSTLILGFYPVFLRGIIVINYSNEILVTLFYIISLIMVLNYLKSHKEIYLFFYLIFYVLISLIENAFKSFLYINSTIMNRH